MEDSMFRLDCFRAVSPVDDDRLEKAKKLYEWCQPRCSGATGSAFQVRSASEVEWSKPAVFLRTEGGELRQLLVVERQAFDILLSGHGEGCQLAFWHNKAAQQLYWGGVIVQPSDAR